MLGSESTSVHASKRYLDRFLVHFNLGVVSMNNYPSLLVSYTLFGPCHLLQVVVVVVVVVAATARSSSMPNLAVKNLGIRWHFVNLAHLPVCARSKVLAG